MRAAGALEASIEPVDDNKRQRRTDSVEIYVDPRGNAANTAETFIAGIMPSMGSMTGPPGAGRDRDNHQGVALSIIQSAGDRVPLGGHSPTSPHLEIVSVERKKDRITAVVRAPVKGAAKLFVWDGESVLAEMERNMPAGERRVNMRVPGLPSVLKTTEVTVLASFQSEDTVSAATRRLE